MTTPAVVSSFDVRSAVLAGADVCHEAGLTLPDEANRPRFEDDIWDFTHVVGLPAQMARCTRRFDFAAIIDARWRLVARNSCWRCSPPDTCRSSRCHAPIARPCT
ncbi:hypothetical protein GCM10009753_73310 [Streptantibioticus ferralitis]